jgi:hypothetical protein
MESAALARAAAEGGVPFTVLRLVTDTPAAPLPPLARSLAAAFAARGLERGGHGLRAIADAARRPAQTARFVRASLGWCRALRVAWRAEGRLAVASAEARGDEPRRAAHPR